MALDCVEIETGPDTTGTVIWMHGLGADAHDFEPIVPMFDLVSPVHFVFPNAPERPVTINGGMQMRAWYDIDPAAGPGSGDADIQTSTEQITELIDQEVANGTPTERIVLAGFSQGGVIALQLGLSIDARLAGIMALSTHVHEPDQLIDRVSFASVDVPIFMAHGLMDPMIPITRAVTSREALTKLNYQVEWHEYGMGHQVSPEEINHIGDWLNRVLPRLP